MRRGLPCYDFQAIRAQDVHRKNTRSGGTDKQGTNILGLIKAAEKLGFTAKGVKGNQEAFFSQFPLPCIAHVVVNGSLLHYVVIHKITKKQIVIADPAKGIVKKTPEEFFKEWTGIFVFLVPDANFEKGNDTKGIFARFTYLLRQEIVIMSCQSIITSFARKRHFCSFEQHFCTVYCNPRRKVILLSHRKYSNTSALLLMILKYAWLLFRDEL